MKYSKTLITILTALSLGNLQAATIFDESDDGQLSSDGLAPTSLGILALGQNDILGQIGGGERDHFTFTIATGQILDSITLVSGTGANHFFGLDDQNTFGASATDLLIAGLFTATTTESPDFLDTFSDGGSLGGSGVTGSSLEAGNYTILVNETAGGSNSADFQLRLTTTSIPEPSSTILLSLASLGLLRRRR